MTNGTRPPKAAMLVAQRIMRDVSRDDLHPGDMLLPERIMLEKYEIGRGTLREALRLLEFHGVIALKPGPKGGPVLLDPDPSHLASTMLLLMQVKQAPFRAIMEVRATLEPKTGALAAERMSDEQIAELGRCLADMRDHMDDDYIFFDTNQRFHDIIAWGSGNALFGYIVDSLLGILDGTVAAVDYSAVGSDYPQRRRKAILKAHEEIYAMIAARDAAGAEARMQEHIDAYVRYVERKHPKLLEQTIRWDARS